MNNVISLAEDKLVLGGFLFDEAVVLAKNRKHNKPSSSGMYCIPSCGHFAKYWGGGGGFSTCMPSLFAILL